MIPLSALQATRTIITHDNCPDGTASAIILRDALPAATIQFVQYGTDEYKNLPAEPGMLFCDFSPPAERAQEFVNAGALVLDHHKYAKGVVEMFGENGVFADETTEPGVCGAVLAYLHVWKRLTPPALASAMEPFLEQFATLAGVRDTWQKHDPRWGEACAQAAVLSFIPNERWLAAGLVNIRGDWAANYGPLGKLLIEKLNADTARVIEKGWRFTTIKGTRVIVIPSKGLTSDAAEMLGNEVDLVVGFGYTYEKGSDKPLLVLSTRSRGSFDCGSFCKAHGGGGHTKAAGCSFGVELDALNPYAFIAVLLRHM